jgi:pimeloyl-ACP methyl ester carboxylesterase
MNEMLPPGWPPEFQAGDPLRREWAHLQRLAAIAGLEPEQVVMPSQAYVKTGDLTLHYVDWHAVHPAEASILFLHGGALQARTWDAVCMFLRDTYRCVALDLRGHGESDWSSSRDYDLSAHAGDVSRFITKLGLGPVVLVGHSLGGLAGMTLAGQESPGVAGLILVDIAPTTNDRATGRVRDFITSRRGFASADELLDHVLQFNPNRRTDLLAGSLSHNIRRLPDGTLSWKYDPAHFASPRDESWEAQLWASVRRASCPILLVRGGRSSVVSDRVAEQLVTTARNARSSSIEGAGHTVQGDAPRLLAQMIRDFVRARVAQPGTVAEPLG